MFVSNVIPVEDVLVRKDVTETRFACDLKKCKGACCTLESEYGAPLLEEEVGKIEKILNIVKDYLPEDGKDVIEEEGFYEVKDGEILTKSVDNKQCVFVYFENGIARCGIEKAFLDGKTDFKKPISCHLFPIRVSYLGGEILRYEKFSECTPALEKGREENITIMEFCEESLTRKYGEKWYSKLKETVNSK
jgi:Protein of unknown function (DUF3109)